MAHHYSPPLRSEMKADPMLYGYLVGAHPKLTITRQHHVYMPNAQRPHRIDFRIGGTHPIMMEFALRPVDGTNQLAGSTNKNELFKLTRVPNTQAVLRVLLLVDLGHNPLTLLALKATYDPINAGTGRFQRHPVRVVYAHWEGHGFHFLWRPYA